MRASSGRTVDLEECSRQEREMNAMDEERYKLSDIRSTKRFLFSFLRLLSLAFIMLLLLSLYYIVRHVFFRFASLPSFSSFLRIATFLFCDYGKELSQGKNDCGHRLYNRCAVNYQQSTNWSSFSRSANITWACLYLRYIRAPNDFI